MTSKSYSEQMRELVPLMVQRGLMRFPEKGRRELQEAPVIIRSSKYKCALCQDGLRLSAGTKCISCGVEKA